MRAKGGIKAINGIPTATPSIKKYARDLKEALITYVDEYNAATKRQNF